MTDLEPFLAGVSVDDAMAARRPATYGDGRLPAPPGASPGSNQPTDQPPGQNAASEDPS